MLYENRVDYDYQSLVNDAITRLKKLGFNEFKADVPRLERPKMFVNQQDSTESFMPDMTVKRGQRKGYVDIASKSGDLSRLVQKWKQFARLAALKNTFFMIIAPKGTIVFTKKLLSENGIDAKMIRMQA